MDIPGLAELQFDLLGGTPRPLNVCIVSSEFLAPEGGIGTATRALTRHLAADGHRVTLLYTSVSFGRPHTIDHRPWQYWTRTLAAEGINLQHIAHSSEDGAWRQKSWLVKEFLATSEFDLVYFNDLFGSGYYSLLAKRAGLTPFAQQLQCVITHGAMEWIFTLNDQNAPGPVALEWMAIERRSVELADVVIAPSRYLLQQYKSYGWDLPKQSFHQPYPIFWKAVELDRSRRIPIKELVFFGRLETRKGLWLFCEALDRLGARASSIEVSFLGKPTSHSGVSSALQIVNRSSRWPCPVRLLHNYDQDEALAYIQQPGRIAVMPSLADNSPCTVYECMAHAIPFITTLGSGADELIHPDSWHEVMAEPNAKSLLAKINKVLEEGALLANPRFDPTENLKIWSAWHRHVSQYREQLIGQVPPQITSRDDVRSNDDMAALMVIFDSGTCALSLLIENLISHIKRFGRKAVYLILTSRDAQLQDTVLDMFTETLEATPTRVVILDAETADEAHRLIVASQFVFFFDAQTELTTPFYTLALNILKRGSGVVSCVLATRRDREREAQIEELASGDLPGFSSLGTSIGGGVFASTGATLGKHILSSELYDKQLGEFPSSFSLGQDLMHRCRLTKTPIHLVPIVGAIETLPEATPRRMRSFSDARRATAALGIAPTLSAGGAPWVAVSALGEHLKERQAAPFESSSFLSPDHPVTIYDAAGQKPQKEGDLPILAAALGRLQTALELEAGKGASAERVRYLADTAANSVRLRPEIELTGLLTVDRVVEFGRTAVPVRAGVEATVLATLRAPFARPKSATLVPDIVQPAVQQARELDLAGVQVYVDARRLSIRDNRIIAVSSLRSDGPGKFYYFDVPLCGNSCLTIELCSKTSDSVFLRIRAIDQRDGLEIGTTSARVAPNGAAKLSIPLFEIYGLATIIFELSGPVEMELVAESIKVH